MKHLTKRPYINLSCITLSCLTGALLLLAAPMDARAEHNMMHDVVHSVVGDHPLPDDIAGKYYMEYEQREPCQYYRVVPPSLMAVPVCDRTVAADGPMKLLPVVASYTIYFDFDKSNIRKNQWGVLDQVVREMNVYHPTQVTVVGHTDTSGSMDYNRTLSAKRADSVSKELTARNIANFYLDEQAMGEENLAVPTPDGTRLEENRRVVIQFRK